ncbi:MAG: hypothetical protein ACON47_05860 [Flavobacteriaceae bacterium]
MKPFDNQKIINTLTAISLLVSLIFVAVQINQSNHLAKATVRQTINDNDVEFLKSYLDQTVVPIANYKLNTGDMLSDYEKQQIIWQQHINFRIFDNGYYQFKNGLLDESEWNKYLSIINTLLKVNPYVRVMWNTYGENFSKDFQALMELQMEQ